MNLLNVHFDTWLKIRLIMNKQENTFSLIKKITLFYVITLLTNRM